MGLVMEKSERWDSDLIESTKMWWRFSDAINRAVNFTPRRMKVTQRFTHRENYDTRFYVKTQYKKNHEEEGETSLFTKCYNKLYKAKTLFQSLYNKKIISMNAGGDQGGPLLIRLARDGKNRP